MKAKILNVFIRIFLHIHIIDGLNIITDLKECNFFHFNNSNQFLQLQRIKNDIWLKTNSDFKYLTVRIEVNETEDRSPAFIFKTPLILDEGIFERGNWSWTALDVYERSSFSKDTYVIRAITMHDRKMHQVDTKLWRREYSVKSMELRAKGSVHVAYDCNDESDIISESDGDKSVSGQKTFNKDVSVRENLNSGQEKELSSETRWNIIITALIASILFILFLIALAIGIYICLKKNKTKKKNGAGIRKTDENLYEEIPERRREFQNENIRNEEDEQLRKNLIDSIKVSSLTDVNWYSLYDIPKKPSVAVPKMIEGDSGILA